VRKFLGGFNGASVGGGRWIANGAVFPVDADGNEYATQFDFPRARVQQKRNPAGRHF
jgi:hypothetical protein